MSTAAIKMEKLSKEYRLGMLHSRRVQALQSLDLVVETGQVFGLLGPNGAGKSTAIKLLLNLICPSSGQASVFGMPPSAPEARRFIGFVPENPAPYEYLTGLEFVSFSMQLTGASGPAVHRQARAIIERVGMHGAQHLQIRRYSKGMIQRIALAAALVTCPKLLILDEPTSGLDVLGRQLIRDIIIEQRRQGMTVLLCSHIIPDVEVLCDRVAVLVEGKLVKEGSIVALLKQDDAPVEATVEGLPTAAFEQVKPLLQSWELREDRHLLRFEQHRDADILHVVLAAGARLTQLQRTRYSLEDLFIQTLPQSPRRNITT